MQTIGGLVDKEELYPHKIGGKNMLITWRLTPAYVKLLDGTAWFVFFTKVNAVDMDFSRITLSSYVVP